MRYQYGRKIYFLSDSCKNKSGIVNRRYAYHTLSDNGFVRANEPPEAIRDHFRLTIKQTDDVLKYIKTHYDEVDREYLKIVAQSEKNRRYWHERNKKRFDRLAKLSRNPKYKKVWDKIAELKENTKC